MSIQDELDEALDDLDAIRQRARDHLTAQLKSDSGRLLIGFVFMCLFFYPFDFSVVGWTELKANLRIVCYVAGFATATALITHLTRRLLFPYIDLKRFSDKALSDPLSAGMVFFGVCLIIATTIYSAAGFFK
jgi:hypothetical protein